MVNLIDYFYSLEMVSFVCVCACVSGSAFFTLNSCPLLLNTCMLNIGLMSNLWRFMWLSSFLFR